MIKASRAFAERLPWRSGLFIFQLLCEETRRAAHGFSTVGRAALGLFAAIFFTAGMISLAFILLKLSIPEWRVNHQFVETTCKILSTQVVTDAAGLKRPEFQVAYAIDGNAAVAWSRYDIASKFQPGEAVDKLVEQFAPGTECDCWYDPRDPQTVVLARGYSLFAWLMPLLPAAFIFLGGARVDLCHSDVGKIDRTHRGHHPRHDGTRSDFANDHRKLADVSVGTRFPRSE